jgi:tRNA-2-methylthio-N6-dimethylallyladenosine synthase
LFFGKYGQSKAKKDKYHPKKDYICRKFAIFMQSVDDKIIVEEQQGTALVLAQTPVGAAKKMYLESYGCQMNFSDSEIVAAILLKEGYQTTADVEKADLIMLNTCSIREKAEQTVRNRLVHFNGLKRKKPSLLIGVLGCMAERLKDKFLQEEKIVDFVVGPDAYRDLPMVIQKAGSGQKAVNVLLSREETYAEISPIRLGGNGVSAFISIMRGCDNMCSFCVVPFTRGRERSRDLNSILHEARYLLQEGYKEITLLGQNVDSYKWQNTENDAVVSFAQLLEAVALVSPSLRIRFSTSHPKDMTDEVLAVMAKYDNICKYIHLPVQSGNDEVLDRMNRGYTADWYKNRIDAIRRILPTCAISSDIIAGFCGETEEQHQDTLNMMEYVGYDFAYMFKYSERPNTLAQRKYQDDVPEEVKSRRLQEIVDKQMLSGLASNQKAVGKVFEVLIEGESKKSNLQWQGRTTHNKMVIFDKTSGEKGSYVQVKIKECTSATLFGEIV